MNFRFSLVQFPAAVLNTALRLATTEDWTLRPSEVIKVRVSGQNRVFVYVHAEILQVGRKTYYLFQNTLPDCDITERYLAADINGFVCFKAPRPAVLREVIQQHEEYKNAAQWRAMISRKAAKAA